MPPKLRFDVEHTAKFNGLTIRYRRRKRIPYKNFPQL